MAESPLKVALERDGALLHLTLNRPKANICDAQMIEALQEALDAHAGHAALRGVLLDAEGNLAHSEMGYGDSTVMVGNEWSADHKSPKSIGGKNTQTVHVQLAEREDIDAHCERARKAGAIDAQRCRWRRCGAHWQIASSSERSPWSAVRCM